MSDLIDRLREDIAKYNNPHLYNTQRLEIEAADALEANAKRIAELESEVARLRKLLEPPKSWRDDPELEAKAKAIYETWKDQDGWVPWVAYGNSTKQDEARAAARKELS